MYLTKLLLCTALTLLLCSFTRSGRDLSQEYRFVSRLYGDDYVLYWNTNLQSKKIEFAVNVSTKGWVGFGLSPNGQMPGSDVVIGWVDSTGKVEFYDRFAATRSLPAIDTSQDWFLTRGSEENGRTILEFYRNFTTCDDSNDLDIKAETARVIWSYNSNDPFSFSQLAELIHERKGSSSLNLLGGILEDRVESDSRSLTILNDNVLIPSNEDTTYWCTVHKLPEEIEQQEIYLYKISPAIYSPSAVYVHHIISYLCTNLNGTHVGASQQCSGTGNIDIDLCRRTGIAFGAWAVGGTDFVFPDGVGYPLGGKGSQYIVLEVHYDNPNLDAGVIDNSGFELFYVEEEPANRAGLLTLGHIATSSMMIPPQASNYIVNALCPEECTRALFPLGGINIFANLLHTHLAGHGLVVRHLRKTSNCSGLEELPPIDLNTRYDFNYQQVTYLPKPVTVLPGDIVQLQCSYQTTDAAYQTMVLGGERTTDEMCFTFFYYYPEAKLTYCVGRQIISDEFSEQNFDEQTQASLRRSIWTRDRKEIKNIFKKITWDPETVEQFQDSVQSNNYHAQCLDSSNLTATITTSTKLPEIKCPYDPPTKDCTVAPLTADSAIHVYFYTPLVLLSFLISQTIF